MLTIDGSQGEGGGQVLRTALTLAACTGRPLRLEKIRAGRSRPGLLRQHLAAAQAIATITGGELEGAAPAATRLVFHPGPIRPGEYRFAIGSAGSTTLLLQTVLPPLLTADGPTSLVLEGGTHNPMAPPFDFIERVYLPVVNRLGPRVRVELERPGFYPAGGGRLRVTVEPCERLKPLLLEERGEILERRARALVAALPGAIARRELDVVQAKLGWEEPALELRQLDAAWGPGNVIMLELRCQHATEICTGFGERGVSAEQVAGRAVEEMRRYLAAGAPVGEHLADQLQLLLALAGGRFLGGRPSAHASTNGAVIRSVLGVDVMAQPAGERVWAYSSEGAA